MWTEQRLHRTRLTYVLSFAPTMRWETLLHHILCHPVPIMFYLTGYPEETESAGHWLKLLRLNKINFFSSNLFISCVFVLDIETQCISWVSIAAIKHRVQNQPGEVWFLYSLQSTIQGSQAKAQGRNGEAEAAVVTMDGIAYRLFPHGLLSLLFHRTQDHLPRGGHSSQWVKPSKTSHQSRKCTASLPTDHFAASIFSVETPPSQRLLLVSGWHKTCLHSHLQQSYLVLSLDQWKDIKLQKRCTINPRPNTINIMSRLWDR